MYISIQAVSRKSLKSFAPRRPSYKSSTFHRTTSVAGAETAAKGFKAGVDSKKAGTFTAPYSWEILWFMPSPRGQFSIDKLTGFGPCRKAGRRACPSTQTSPVWTRTKTIQGAPPRRMHTTGLPENQNFSPRAPSNETKASSHRREMEGELKDGD